MAFLLLENTLIDTDVETIAPHSLIDAEGTNRRFEG